jgi:preprotein translocase subunit SecA
MTIGFFFFAVVPQPNPTAAPTSIRQSQRQDPNRPRPGPANDALFIGRTPRMAKPYTTGAGSASASDRFGPNPSGWGLRPSVARPTLQRPRTHRARKSTMLQNLLAKMFGTKNERELKKIRPIVEHINGLEAAIKALDDDQLRGKTAEFRAKLDLGASLDDLLPEAFAVTREAAWRRLGQRHYDVQLIGGYALHSGTIAEMRTGEGKTLVATLPAYLNALSGRGVHVVTVNDYLAKRDCEWMSLVYNFLGLSSGVVTTDIDEHVRRAAYQADITYGQNNELGFDYLRDNMKFSLDDYVHRYLTEAESALFTKQAAKQASANGGKHDKLLNFAIVDEVDSILIDEARTPLIISGRGEDSSEPYLRANAVIPFLKREVDYMVDEKGHTVVLTESGHDKVEQRLKLDNLYDAQNMQWVHYIHAALKAHTLYRNEVNYLIEDGKIVIIDEHTGRKMPGRRWSDGIHQSIEAKEGLKIQQESQTLATITFQNYFRMYGKLCGMTGTAETEAEEFAKIYNLDVLVIPTNRHKQRLDHEDVIYKSERAKFDSVIKDIQASHEKGQPVLVGTISVEKSQFLSHLLDQLHIPHNVLNAKQHAREAEIVAQAGRLGAVTISTNMAGRGTDILLGGNAELLARREVFGASKVHEHFDEQDPAYVAALAKYKALCAEEKQQVLAAGGLKIIGTERHESRRIDNQLRGRSGRQGDPGESRFYLSLDDDLMRVFGGDRVRKIMEFLRIPEDEPIEDKMVSNAIEGAQKRVEGQHFDARKNVLEYDDVMNLQRKSIYALRRQVLGAEQTRDLVRDVIGDVVYALVDDACPKDVRPGDWDMDALEERLFELTHQELDLVQLDRTYDALSATITQHLETEFDARRGRLVEQIAHSLDAGEESGAAEQQWREFERETYLRGIDNHWREHLKVMDALKEGVYLEAYAQKDPKLIYKKEGHELFRQMIDRIKWQVVETLFHVEVKSAAELEQMKQEADRRRAAAKRQMQEVHASESLHEEAAQVEKMARQLALQQAQLARQAAQAQRKGEAAPALAPELLDAAMAEHAHSQGAPAADAEPAKVETFRRERPKIGRNDPCWCGSGNKYKKCHMQSDEEAGVAVG